MDFSPKSLLLLVFMLTAFPAVSFYIEKSAIKLSRNVANLLAGLNLLANLVYPIFVISHF